MLKTSGARKLKLALIVIGLFAVAVWALRGDKASLETVTVGRGDIQNSVTAVGTLQPRRYVDVGVQVSGQIRKIHVQPGDTVEQNKLLAEIDPSVAQAKVDAGRAALAGLKAQLTEQEALLELARQQANRQERMAAEGSTREEDVQIAQATLRTALARIDNLKAQIEQTQSTLKGDEAQLGYTRIYAPMAGTVVSLDAREGQTLNATQQAPLILRIADLTAMTVWAEVSEADIKRVKPGMRVYFSTLGMENRTWEGKVRQILPSPPGTATQGAQAATTTPATGKVVLYTVLFDVENKDGELMPQMTAQVFFVVAQASNVVTVPMAALQPIHNSPSMYLARVRGAEGTISSREVKIGATDRLTGEVLSGLSEGEELVLGVAEKPVKARWFKW
ncbi:MAG TPA: efflux RND transporter periplasmic adaptor subunit [Povalibacter sp.]|nr:efflux RND transporter periplasmic adaptor subunit [Povalibacter sp.]